MRFIDKVRINARSGKGGKGCISFRREKFVPHGGPDGGDGGAGGDVYLRADRSLTTLYDLRLKGMYQAENGRPGQGKGKHGRAGEDLVLNVPMGTTIYEETEAGEHLILADLTEDGEKARVVQGGQGGKGNVHYKSSTNRAPQYAQSGEPGEEKRLLLELKLVAHVGLLGLPNAGKSTLISTVSAAKPRVAPYPFTTVVPHLGVIFDHLGRQLVMADIPGLMEGAHAGYGLGDSFLRHISRSSILVHILSVEEISLDDPWAGFDLLNNELRMYDKQLAQKPQIRVINKIDLWPGEAVEQLRKQSSLEGKDIRFLSLYTGDGVEELLSDIWAHWPVEEGERT